MTAKLWEILGKLGGALRANRMVKVATHMIAARYETKLRLPFQMGRTSDMCAPHYDWMILSPFWLAGNEISWWTVLGEPDHWPRGEAGSEAGGVNHKDVPEVNCAIFCPVAYSQ